MRVIGDTIFAVGVFALAYFIFGLKFGWTVSEQIDTRITGSVPEEQVSR